MKEIKMQTLRWIGGLALALMVSSVEAQENPGFKTQEEKDSYAIGADLARTLKRQTLQMNSEALLQGMRDVLSGGKLQMSDQELRETLRVLQNEQRRKQILARGGTAAVAAMNAEKGLTFLSQNKTNEGVICLPSGLQYKVLKPGTGRKPTITNSFDCRFRGTLIDGQEFAGSDPEKPATFKLSEVIPGWREALQFMPLGSKWQLFIPPQLAYGEQGAGHTRLAPKIGPNATLIYELELVDIK